MKRFIPFGIILGLSACAHQPVRTVTNSNSILIMTCQRPNGGPLYLEQDFDSFLDAAKARKRSQQIAVQNHGHSSIDFASSMETHSDYLQDRASLIFNYYPYLDEKTGAVWVKGQVTCGLLEGNNNVNRYNYSEGILNIPVQIDVTKPIFPAIQYDGIGGYRITISIENQKETKQHFTQ